MGNRTRQKNKTGDGKVKSNDSLEIPDRWETSDIHGLPSGPTEQCTPFMVVRPVSKVHFHGSKVTEKCTPFMVVRPLSKVHFHGSTTTEH